MKRPAELRRELAEVRAEMVKIDTAAGNAAALETEAQTKWDSLDRRAGELSSAIDRADKLAEMERRSPANQNTPEDERRAVGQFDIATAILGQLSRQGVDVGRIDDGREREVSQELRHRSGATDPVFAGGLIVPVSAMRGETRALTYGAGSGAGAGLQAEEYHPDKLVQELQAVALAGKLGVQYWTGLRGAPVTAPSIDSGLTLQFATEGSAFTPGDPDVNKKSLTPKIGAAFTSLSPITLQQPQASSIVGKHLLRVSAAGLDRVTFAGSGSGGEPEGLWTVLTPTALGEPTWAEILGLTEAIELDNAAGSLGWALNPSAKRKLRSTPKVQLGSPVDFTANSYIMDSANTLTDYAAVSSTVIPTTGSPPSAAGIIHGDFSEVVVGVWESASILTNPYSTEDYLRGQIGMRVMLLCDVLVTREEAFRSATISI